MTRTIMDSIKPFYDHHPKAVMFASAATLRILLVLLFPALPDILTARAEISTPTNSFKRLQEGLFLYERGVDPYDGGLFHQAPLLLPIFGALPGIRTWLGTVASVVIFTALDIGCLEFLWTIVESGAAATSRRYVSPRKKQSWSPRSVAAVYAFNPYTLLNCLARSTSTFTTFFLLLSIAKACRHDTVSRLQSAFALAIASYISLWPVLLTTPIALLAYDNAVKQPSISDVSATPGDKVTDFRDSGKTKTLQTSALKLSSQYIATLTVSIATLFSVSRALLPSWNFLSSVYLTPLTLPDLTPNVGLWWYFFIELFDPFRSFFLGVFWLHIASYSVPLSLRLKDQPIAAAVAMWGVVVVFQPYANVGDAGAWLSSLCLLNHTFELTSTHRYPFLAISVLLYTTLLGPAFHYLWIYAGSGNANFFYAITLVWNLGLMILLTDAVWSVLRDEWEDERQRLFGQDVRGKEVRQI
ncbi:PIG-U-domain-containing protein [Polychaeton citri CBS 116435]|uniref:PIG-U-domain-containing protein n=1 Tax=Polychaeton citri CBS 116435 TaxID=1314669 RepID=A0A9P4Q6Q9_9PEZI|nr:PIG-U-domain-containing protein [Polychaeton citri CBS 116435]